MKKSAYALLTLILIMLAYMVIASITGCTQKKVEKKPEFIITQKVLLKKTESIQSGTKWKYSIWSDRLYPVSDVHTVYYFIYTDKSTEQVDLSMYSTTEIGDTIEKKQLKQW